MSNLRVERFDSPCDLPESVMRFWQEETHEHPMRSPEWLKSWWNSYSVDAPKHGCIYVVFAEQIPIALAPLYVRIPVPGIRSLRLMGDKGICSDHSSIIVNSNYEALALKTLAETLMTSAGLTWDTLCFEGVDLEDRCLNQLIREMQKLKLPFTSENAVDCWSIALPTDWEQYLMTVSKNHRKRCRRWQKDFFDTGRATVVDVHAKDWRPAWQRLIELNRARRAKKNDKSAFDEPRFLNCHQEYLEHAIESSQASLRELYVDGQHVATEYILYGAETVYCYQSGMLTTDNGVGFGNLSMIATIRHAIERGCTKLDLLRGDEDYKHHWGAERLHTITWRASVQSLTGSVYRGLREAVELMRDAKHLLRSSLIARTAPDNLQAADV